MAGYRFRKGIPRIIVPDLIVLPRPVIRAGLPCRQGVQDLPAVTKVGAGHVWITRWLTEGPDLPFDMDELIKACRAHQTLLEPEQPEFFSRADNASSRPPDAGLESPAAVATVGSMNEVPPTHDFQHKGGGAVALGQQACAPAMPGVSFLAELLGLAHASSKGLQTDVGVSPDYADPSSAPLPLS